MPLERTPWLDGVPPKDAIRLHPRRTSRPLDPGSSKMGWPFLWPAAEPWPLCMRQDPGISTALEAELARAERLGIDSDSRILGLPTIRETYMLLIERCRSGHNASHLPVLPLNRSEFPEFPFPAGSDLFQLLWCPTVHFEGGGGSRMKAMKRGRTRSRAWYETLWVSKVGSGI